MLTYFLAFTKSRLFNLILPRDFLDTLQTCWFHRNKLYYMHWVVIVLLCKTLNRYLEKVVFIIIQTFTYILYIWIENIVLLTLFRALLMEHLVGNGALFQRKLWSVMCACKYCIDKFRQVYFHYIQKVTYPWGKYM